MILFVSDLHLAAETPQLNALFLDFLDKHARKAEALYILGDLFDAWIGDDDLPSHAPIITALRELTSTGVALYVMAGNRDFLLGDGFAQATGAVLIPDPYVLSLPSWQFVLSHGDSLCLLDQAYQKFRNQVRQPAWQQQFLQQPLTLRRQIASKMRAQSEVEKQRYSSEQMDLEIHATEDFLREHGYATMIHGHTHHPAIHDHLIDGIHVERWVLSDWHEASTNQPEASPRGECLCWDERPIDTAPLLRRIPLTHSS